uniref:DUF4408 domain-containing protein n=1 Tax=Leersia perrieri TaxID=77586 RepID=A0A0D9W605_9ORYZ
MGRSRRTSTAANVLVVALLIISLLMPLHLPVAYARHVAVLKSTDSSSNSGINIRSGDVNVFTFTKEQTSASGAEQRSTTDANNSGENPGRRRLTAGGRTVEMRTSASATKHHRGNEINRIYEMLKRDYSSRARRRSPINNGEPLQEELP